MVLRSSSSIRFVTDTLSPNLAAFPVKLDTAIGAVMQYHEATVQDYARSNAPWTDRTTNARGGLFAKAYRSGRAHGIVLYHTVSYGIWLEVRWGGKYRIIVPTIQRQGVAVMKTLQGVIRRLT
jgi:hypothetical protein